MRQGAGAKAGAVMLEAGDESIASVSRFCARRFAYTEYDFGSGTLCTLNIWLRQWERPGGTGQHRSSHMPAPAVNAAQKQ